MTIPNTALGFRRYAFKIYPSHSQAAVLHDTRFQCADLWDGALEFAEGYREKTGKWPPFKAQGSESFGAQVKPLRDACPEWKALTAMTAHAIIENLVLAHRAFQRRMKELVDHPEVYEAQAAAFQARKGFKPSRRRLAGYPRYKYRDTRQSDSIPLGCMDGPEAPPRDVVRTSGKNGWLLTQNPLQPLSWRLYIKGITAPGETLHLRGELPCDPQRFRNANVLWRNRTWWFSVCTELDCSRDGGAEPTTVRFGLIDEFATVNGHPEILPGLVQSALLGERIDELKAQRDIRFPLGKSLSDEDTVEKRAAGVQIAKLYAKAGRVVRNALHVWTCDLISRSSDLTIITPDLRRQTQSPRGNEESWGANTETASQLNRHVLGQCPGMAIAMLQYKAAEAGIRCDVVKDKTPDIQLGNDLVALGKEQRRGVRRLKNTEEY